MAKSMVRQKICFIATTEISIKAFLIDHLLALSKNYDTYVITNTTNPDFLKSYGLETNIIALKIERKISLINDMTALYTLYQVFREHHFSICHSIMPKSGLLSMLAGLFARVPIRVHTFTGQVWKNSAGTKRFILKIIDRVLAMCATHILVDSPSQREFLISEGIVKREKSSVIENGSMCGVDEMRFCFDVEDRRNIRKTLNIASDDIMFLFLGRMNRDKGILDLSKAFASLCGRFGNVRLLLVGPDEENIGEKVLEICSQCSDKIHIMEYTDAPEKYMSAADVFCLPSYREGFGLVVIEAAAVGVPSIGSKIYGITDAIDDGVTGFLFEPAAHHDLMLKMTIFVEDPSLIRSMGERAKDSALKKYSKEKITSAMIDYYKGIERTL
jgi:glycosyltransferase involved in cell wall biosynthesis